MTSEKILTGVCFSWGISFLLPSCTINIKYFWGGGSLIEIKRFAESLKVAAGVVHLEAQVGVLGVDPSGIITDVNKQMEALTGCTRDELIGAPLKNYFLAPSLFPDISGTGR